jgi:hypothetical protein
MNVMAALTNLPARSASRATRYVVTVKGEAAFTVLVHRGSVPRRRIATMLARTDDVISIVKDRG